MAERVAAILAASPGHRDALQALALAGPRGGLLAAGFVRNAVWDALAGRVPDVAGLADLDVVHLDGAAPDAAWQAALRAARGLPWQVSHQGRMAARHGHAPYPDLASALRRWPETATAIGARLAAGRVAILAPFGVADLLGFVLRCPPGGDPAALRARAATKGWLRRWPGIRVIPD
ncbi:nucleotidyltransferase family protein [Falsiroseomonas selenitidurans]|uniref:Nucleotidyltransferase family protein n=1 Tax=Falsiroseomonas selenitidurans TaxID=2716335 RepID=A0ABX1E8G2_9PROT|nr:nucleotidyltransferase family protein [Falsiroseomonas selenitidurans]NKC33088.1 nucleotidyltransferase family protein [Falsiroseomonas selenitidurans]